MIVLDQDVKQKASVAVSLLIELYRVVVSTLLILFVPQLCTDHVCSLSENMESTNAEYDAGLALNFATLGACALLYFCEVRRENVMIEYLEVNPSLPTDSESVGTALQQLDEGRCARIRRLHRYYQHVGRAAIACFVANTVLSGIIIYDYYLDSKTTMTFVTNILFMTMKLHDVHAAVSTEDNVFYSAYLRAKVQFNDVDPQKRLAPGPSAAAGTTGAVVVPMGSEALAVKAETHTEAAQHEVQHECIEISVSAIQLPRSAKT